MSRLRVSKALSRALGSVGVRFLIALVLTLTASTSFATPVRAASEMSVSVGYGGFVQPGRPYPVTVEVTSDELFSGELRFLSQGGSGGITRDVEFAGGTTNDVLMVLDQSPFDSGNLRVELVDDDGKVVDTVNTRLRPPTNSDLVGVFPGAVGAGLPEKTSVRADAGDALLFALDVEELGAGFGVLDPLDVVVVTADDFRSMGDSDIDVLLGWVNLGGRLLVDEPTGNEIPGLPTEWQPIGGQPVSAGVGEVMLTNGSARVGDWQEILEPAPNKARQQDEAFGEAGGFFGGEPLSWSLGRDSGFSLPGVTTMVILLLGYTVLVGPGLWLVLRAAGRPGLAWALVPATAVVVTGVIWVAGSSYRSGVEVAHGTVIQVAPGGTVARSYELLSSRTGGSASVDLPAGWLATGSIQEGAPGRIEVSDQDDTTTISTEVDAGGFVLLGAVGPASNFDGALEIEARSSAPGVIVGTITNRLDVDLSDVGIFADTAGKNIGEIAAGESVDFELASAPVNPVNGQPVEFNVWPGAVPSDWFGNGNRASEPGNVNLSLWGEVAARSSVNARSVGDLVVAGWTDELASPIDPAVGLGRTLVMGRAAIAPAGGVVTNVAIQRDLVRSGSELGSNFQINNGWGGGTMVRFVLPDTTDELVLQLPASQQRVDVFDDGVWRQLDVEEYDRAVLALPVSAIDNGRVYVKVLINFERASGWRDLSVRTATDADDVEPMRFVPEVAG